MSGRLVTGGLLAFCAVFGAALWYFQVHAFYERTDGLTEIDVAGETRPVGDYRGIAARSSPIKLRACFTVDWPHAPPDAAGDRRRGAATPLTAPHWFDCFDAGRIARDLQSGAATALLAGRDEGGADRYIARYPDGRAFMWRQLNEKYADR